MSDEQKTQGESCGNCAFFVPDSGQQTGSGGALGGNGQRISQKAGYCRFEPPKVFMFPVQSSIQGGQPQLVVQTAWTPTVEEQWCGQHVAVADYADYKETRLGAVEADAET